MGHFGRVGERFMHNGVYVHEITVEAKRGRIKYCLEYRCVRTIRVEATNERGSEISGRPNQA